MHYPIYVHCDSATGFRGSFPDFPLAAAQGKSLEELKVDAKQSVELMYDGSEQLIPVPTCDTSDLRALDMDDGEGIWMFLDIDLEQVTSQVIGIQIGLPDELLQRVDLVARERNMTRSSLIMLGIVRELASQGGEQLPHVDPRTGHRGRMKAAEIEAYIPLL